MRWLLAINARLLRCSNAYVQPKRTAVYHYALKPRILCKDDDVLQNDEHLFKPVAPADKWEHSCSNWDPLISRFIGMMTIRGERENARDAMRLTFREIKLIQVPSPPPTDSRATHIAIKCIIDAAKDKSPDERIWVSLAREVIAASMNQGKAFRMKVDLHKQCEENRAYANYRTY